MIIKVNGRTIELFAGASVGDAIRRHSREAWRNVRGKRAFVFDAWGNEIALDGALSEGDEIFVRSSGAGGES